MSFRILNQAPQYLLSDGRVNAGGRLHFYETDLSTPKDTWSNEALSVLNPNPVVMDATGRTTTDVWGDGEYGVKMVDAAGVVIWTRNNVRADAGAGTSIPALEMGKFLTNDGSNLLWDDVRQVPDPTGSNDYILSTDGTDLLWIAPPSIPAPDIDVTAAGLIVGDGTGERFAIQTGTATIPASASRTSTANITFATAFTKIFAVLPITSTYAVNAYGAGATLTAEGYTVGSASSGATLRANIVDDGGGSGDDILNALSIAWVAIGLVAAS